LFDQLFQQREKNFPACILCMPFVFQEEQSLLSEGRVMRLNGLYVKLLLLSGKILFEEDGGIGSDTTHWPWEITGVGQTQLRNLVNGIWKLLAPVGILALVYCGIQMIYAEDEINYSRARTWIFNVAAALAIAGALKIFLTRTH
jgi:hypothetical protein